jgi:hypothetical protein
MKEGMKIKRQNNLHPREEKLFRIIVTDFR